MLQKIENDLMLTKLVVLVHHLPSRQVAFHANQAHILGLTISTKESLYMGAVVKQIGILQTALSARADMLSS